ncbi:hypothetical protein PENTCL1PPCAC_19936, partial [Pristionchus entomophagus]
QVLGIIILNLLCQTAQSSVICYSCYGKSRTEGATCSYDKLTVCDTSCGFTVSANGSWSTGCSTSAQPSTTPQICTFAATTRTTTCLCGADFCNDFDTTVDDLLDVWNKDGVTIPMMFPSSMTLECFECGQVNITGVGIVVLPCDAAHTCHGDYCVTKRGENPHSYCGTAWDGTPNVSCTKMPNQPEICICTESFCNPVLDPVQEPVTTTTLAAAPPTTTPAATTAAPSGDTTSHPKCKNGAFTPNTQAVTMGEKLKNIISNAFNAVNIGWFKKGIDDHICNYSSPT